MPSEAVGDPEPGSAKAPELDRARGNLGTTWWQGGEGVSNAERGQRAGPSKLVRNPGLGPTSSRSHYGVLKAGT